MTPCSPFSEDTVTPLDSSSSIAPHPRPRPPPARQGAPASTRNFALSSAGGANVKLLNGGSGGGDVDDAGVDGDGQSVNGARARARHATRRAQLNKQAAWGETYNVKEETVRNDYSTHYVKTRERPQNHVRGADVESRFAEYPKLAKLLEHKHRLTDSPSHSIPPTFMETRNEPMPSVLPALTAHRFDVILMTPPPETSFDELRALDLGRVAATPGFVWLWVGSGARGNGIGLEKGRELLAAWGYRRSEDIVWLKTNKVNPAQDFKGSDSLFTPTVEHCLMGIRGTVRRSNDPWFVHCNVDTDVIIWEGDPHDTALKPPELQTLIENFCLGTRRLHLYGSPHSLRRGWLTVGSDFAPLDPSRSKNGAPVVLPIEGEFTRWEAIPYERTQFESYHTRRRGPEGDVEQVSSLLPFVEELDALRPKSPPPRNGQPSSGGLGRGRGAGLGVTRSTAANALPTHNGLMTGYQGRPPRGRGRGRGAANPFPLQSHPPPFPPQHGHDFAHHHAMMYQHGIHNYSAPPPPPPPTPQQLALFHLQAQQQHLAALQHQQHLMEAQFAAMQMHHGHYGYPVGGPGYATSSAQMEDTFEPLAYYRH